jgi:hypothetical protein
MTSPGVPGSTFLQAALDARDLDDGNIMYTFSNDRID